MKALTVRQPWAQLIADGHKTIELRTWATKYRGPLLITASARQNPDKLPTGCTICIVDLIDCRPAGDGDPEKALSDVYQDDFAWVLANPRPVACLPVKGRLSIWSPPDDLVASL